MHSYNTTAISITDLKDALIYFDHVVPVNLAMEAVREGWHQGVPAEEFRLEEFLPTDMFVSEMLPPELRENVYFHERLAKANKAMRDLFVKMHVDSGDAVEIADGVAKWMIARVIREFGLGEAPVVIPPSMIAPGSVEHADVAISLLSLRLVDAESVSWQQLYEFRRDPGARDQLRRLRLFAFENYEGKPHDFIRDDILTRIDDYERAAQKWGFETKSGVVGALLNSRIVQAGAVLSGLSALCHEPLAAIATAAAPVVVQLGQIAIQIRRQQFAWRDAVKNNPVSYIVRANQELPR